MAESIQSLAIPDYGNIVSQGMERGFTIGQNAQLRQLQLDELRTKREQGIAERSLMNLASTGDSNALAKLAAYNPTAAKGIQDYNDLKVKRQASLLAGVKVLPAGQRDSALKSAQEVYRSEFNEYMPAGMNYSPENASNIEMLIARGREAEKMVQEQLEAPKRMAELQNLYARTGTERLQQAKLGEEVSSMRAERQSAAMSGLSPTAYKTQQQEFGKVRGEKMALLNSVESKLPELLETVNKLSDLGEKATYTYAGQTRNFIKRQLGMEPSKGAISRADYIATAKNQIFPILRDTFGAQFTKAEGDSLLATLGSPNLSPTEKQAELNSFIEQKLASVQSIQTELGYKSYVPDVISKGTFSIVDGRIVKEGQEAEDKSTGEMMKFTGGQWVKTK